MWVQIAPLSRPKFCTSVRFFDGFHAQVDGDPAAASVWQPLVLLVWLRVYQANKLAWGGARDGGKRRAGLVRGKPA